MLAFMAAGLFAYLQLGRQEDPDFTIKTMVIGAQWPGASPEEMTRQVTDRIEKKLEELESLDYTKSVTVAGQTTVFVYLRDTTKAADVAPTWARVRNMIADIKGDFPQGVGKSRRSASILARSSPRCRRKTPWRRTQGRNVEDHRRTADRPGRSSRR
jgi:multidrug efflux pump subunit AcrB